MVFVLSGPAVPVIMSIGVLKWRQNMRKELVAGGAMDVDMDMYCCRIELAPANTPPTNCAVPLPGSLAATGAFD